MGVVSCELELELELGDPDMKGIVFENNYMEKGGRDSGSSLPVGWRLIADSAVSNTGKPFYLPESQGPTEMCLTFAIKISRLGKSISPKFSSRYYCEMAPAVNFRLPALAKTLREQGLSEDPSRNFDKCLMIGDFMPFDEEKKVEARLNGEPCIEFSFSNLRKNIDECISEISRMNTLKMGDILLPGLTEGVSLKEGDLLEIFIDGARAFHVKIR